MRIDQRDFASDILFDRLDETGIQELEKLLLARRLVHDCGLPVRRGCNGTAGVGMMDPPAATEPA